MSGNNMFVYHIQILLNCKVNIRIFTGLLCSRLIMGQYQGNKYMKSEIISLLSNIGPTMCMNKCKSLYGCNGVNFERQQLTCELLLIKPTADNISEKAGSMFAALSSLQPINETACLLSPCSQDHKCIVSRQNKAFCITTVGELIFMETLKSTNYPGAYPNYDVQSWTLAVQNNSRLVLRFQAFHLETNNDLLKIYDKQGGRQMYSLTGLYNRDDIWSKTNGFFITFTSDYSITFSGFSIDVYKTS